MSVNLNPLELGEVYAKLLDRACEGTDGISIQDFVPERYHILVKPLPAKTKVGNIELPNGAELSRTASVVVAVPNDPDCHFQVGDMVYHGEFAGRCVIIEKVAYAVLQYGLDAGDVYGRVPASVLDRMEKVS